MELGVRGRWLEEECLVLYKELNYSLTSTMHLILVKVNTFP